MIKKGISVKKCNKKKQVLYYRILIGRNGAECLSWDLVKVAKLGNHFIAFRVCSLSDSALKENSGVKDHPKFCQEFSAVKKVSVKRSILQKSLIKKVIKSAAKHCVAMAVIAGTNQENTLGSGISFPKCCANQLPENTSILLIHKEMILSTKQTVFQLRGFRLNSTLEFHLSDEITSLEYAEEEVVEEAESHAILSSEDVSTDSSEGLNDHDPNSSLDHDYRKKVSLTSIAPTRKAPPEAAFGWPLLLRSTTPPSHEVLSRLSERNTSVVEWVMSLPSRSTSDVHQKQIINASLCRENDNISIQDSKIEGNILPGIPTSVDESTDGSMKLSKYETLLSLDPGYEEEVSSTCVSLFTRKLSQPKPGWPLLRISAPITLDCSSNPSTRQSQISLVSLKLHSSKCRRFSYSELKRATCQFSSDNLIGEGGCSSVYKGCLSNDKLVAVKVLKSYKEAWDDFFLEVEIISSLKHKNITSLIGVCVDHDNLILVYDFLPKGSLEESLHGNGKEVLPWEVRFKVGVATAEALYYVHNEFLRPVIHRDVKSSNILLSSEFEPKLSDFGLAIWGPTEATCMIHEDVVGTFGYIAPEYFMHGRVSDKVDVYSFGVVLLELLSGRRPIGSKNLKGQESLVKWAKPIIEGGDMEALLDPNLVGDYDFVQMQRMVLVANLCINQSARFRPKMSQILELLRGEKDVKEWINLHVDVKGTCNQEDDDLLLGYGGKPSLDFSSLDTDDGASVSSVDGVSLFCAEGKQHCKLKDYFKEPQN